LRSGCTTSSFRLTFLISRVDVISVRPASCSTLHISPILSHSLGVAVLLKFAPRWVRVFIIFRNPRAYARGLIRDVVLLARSYWGAERALLVRSSRFPPAASAPLIRHPRRGRTGRIVGHPSAAREAPPCTVCCINVLSYIYIILHLCVTPIEWCVGIASTLRCLPPPNTIKGSEAFTGGETGLRSRPLLPERPFPLAWVGG
jgi:hypothetical protein